MPKLCPRRRGTLPPIAGSNPTCQYVMTGNQSNLLADIRRTLALQPRKLVEEQVGGEERDRVGALLDGERPVGDVSGSREQHTRQERPPQQHAERCTDDARYPTWHPRRSKLRCDPEEHPLEQQQARKQQRRHREREEQQTCRDPNEFEQLTTGRGGEEGITHVEAGVLLSRPTPTAIRRATTLTSRFARRLRCVIDSPGLREVGRWTDSDTVTR